MKSFKTLEILLLIIVFSSFQAFSQIEIHDNGKVTMGGMPTSRPACEPYINGSASGSALYIQHNNFTPWSSAIDANVLTPDACSYNFSVYGTSSVFYVYGGGSNNAPFIYCYSQYYNSDSSLKKGIKEIPDALEKLDKIHGYNYHLKTDLIVEKGIEKGKKIVADTFMHSGVLAQEVQQIAPYAVRELKNGKLGVDYI